jgi:carbonic anhydrase
MKRLIRGYRDFRRRRWPAERCNYKTLAKKGQKPEYLIIGCSDSRADPATIFGAHPGEFFIVRNVAAIVPPYEASQGYYSTRAAIAYAVLALEVRHIVVMGHAQCGGVAAALDKKAAEGIPFLEPWVELLDPALQSEEGHAHDHSEAERDAVRLSIARLMEYPFIADRVAAGKLDVDGARFGIADGILEVLSRKSSKFEPVKRGFLPWGRAA